MNPIRQEFQKDRFRELNDESAGLGHGLFDGIPGLVVPGCVEEFMSGVG